MVEVHLAVYDLSGGMARNLSAQFLGPNHVIEMIPHTALLVFGKEYFFGGGIQCVDPNHFRAMRGIQPVKIERLGTTRVSQGAFDSWCQGEASAKFNAGTYDLLQRNCNHFSHEAALQGLQLSRGVPSWILDVPQRFLSSPMGQMIRPMLEQMQITQNAPVQAPVSSWRPQPLATAPFATSNSLSVNNGESGAAGVASNPWRSMGPSAQDCPPPAQLSPAATVDSSDTPSTTRSVTPPSSFTRSISILQKYTKPMLSNDTKSLALCASKVSLYLVDDSSSTKLALQTLTNVLQRPTSIKNDDDDSTKMNQDVEKVSRFLWGLICEGKCVSFALLYLRIVVLCFSRFPAVNEVVSDLMAALSDSFEGSKNEESPSLIFQTPAAKSLAWCVLSNFAGSAISHKQSSAVISSTVVEAAIRDWNDDAIQVRQAACTFLYNFVVCNGTRLDGDEEIVVSLVCSSLESLVEESDATTRLRRLLVGSRVVFGVHHQTTSQPTQKSTSSDQIQAIEGSTYNEMAKDLVKDLGFINLLQELAATKYDKHPDTLECRELAYEMIERLQN